MLLIKEHSMPVVLIVQLTSKGKEVETEIVKVLGDNGTDLGTQQLKLLINGLVHRFLILLHQEQDAFYARNRGVKHGSPY